MSSSSPPSSRFTSRMSDRHSQIHRAPFTMHQEDFIATFTRHADVEWTGGLLDGSGTASAGSGAFSVPVTFPSRIAERADGKTTPEELMAASHAVCYAMVLTNTITKKGGSLKKLRVTATVTAEKSDAG